MTSRKHTISEEELIMYVDGRLPTDRKAAVEDYLATDLQARADVEAWQRQNRDLKALFDRRAEEPVPDRLDPRLIAEKQRHDSPRWLPDIRMVAASVLLLAGRAGGRLAHPGGPGAA